LKLKLPPSVVFVDWSLSLPESSKSPKETPSGPESEPLVIIFPATLKPLNLKLMSPTQICLILVSWSILNTYCSGSTHYFIMLPNDIPLGPDILRMKDSFS
jgi:hypothetical protein